MRIAEEITSKLRASGNVSTAHKKITRIHEVCGEVALESRMSFYSINSSAQKCPNWMLSVVFMFSLLRNKDDENLNWSGQEQYDQYDQVPSETNSPLMFATTFSDSNCLISQLSKHRKNVLVF